MVSYWKLATLCFTSLGVCFSGIAIADYSTDYLRDIAQAKLFLDQDIRNVRAAIRHRGSERAKSIDETVQFVADDTVIPSASVGINPRTGKTEIRISNSYRLLITYIADIMFATSGDEQQTNCIHEYQQYIFDALASNRFNLSNGRKWTRVVAPEQYFAISSISCRHLASSFPIPQYMRQARNEAVGTIVQFTYLHELGHLAKRHPAIQYDHLEQILSSEKRMAAFLALTARSREQEYEADDWAVDQFVKMSNSPWGPLSATMLGYFVAFGGSDCFFEATDSHPNGFQRFSHIARRVQQRSGSAMNQQIESLISETSQLAEKAKDELKCNDSPSLQ